MHKQKEMNLQDIRKLTIEELKAKIAELKKELEDLKFSLRLGQEKNSSSYGAKKKLIARMNTVLNEKLVEGTTEAK